MASFVITTDNNHYEKAQVIDIFSTFRQLKETECVILGMTKTNKRRWKVKKSSLNNTWWDIL